ncbi:Protein of uncharacterised function (DUF1266) [Kingella potus]|uniref:Protein of uncharacterized function (DUF1266) n=1 Tax=Kingella potus TaxID=265175 RepID=A0A377QZB6_9NEIS|nr:DUF1266 domain-containing protein [Kingella potus]UOP00924.1 DUF1266 domain-containing protein [Kingella potus]STR00583.1 Protein of uncharacterised function (DUF1266) [Kingella potus]
MNTLITVAVGLLIVAAIMYFTVGHLFRKPDNDIIRWFNATHGVLLCINNKNIQIYGGAPPKGSWRKKERASLKQWWGITDTASLLDMVRWLMDEGHRAEYRQRGETGGIAGWDYSRALSLLSSGYLCGYLGKKEALDRSLDIARRVQKEFDSWDNFMASYFAGYEYWSEDTCGQRQRVYMALKGKPNSLYKLPWNLELKQAW